jgi:hypothetical protein
MSFFVESDINPNDDLQAQTISDRNSKAILNWFLTYESKKNKKIKMNKDKDR